MTTGREWTASPPTGHWAYKNIAARITRQNLNISYVTIGISILAIVVTLAL